MQEKFFIDYRTIINFYNNLFDVRDKKTGLELASRQQVISHVTFYLQFFEKNIRKLLCPTSQFSTFGHIRHVVFERVVHESFQLLKHNVLKRTEFLLPREDGNLVLETRVELSIQGLGVWESS